jgi:putative membrane protein insertion efficiency factor
VKRALEALLVGLVHFYQRWISPAFPRRCRYWPTCSAYAVEAIRELGPARGAVLAGWRLLRCNPLSDGGIDDVADRRLFRSRPMRSELAARRCREHEHASASTRADLVEAGR